MRRSAALLLALAACGAPPADAPRERVTIPPGATVRQIADSLAAHDVIDSPRWFRLLARVKGDTRRLKSGTYAFARGEGASRALGDLVTGRVLLLRVTVPEGFTIFDVADVAERDLGLARSAVLAAARDSALLRELQVPAPSFEGFLRAETYFFAPGLPAADVIRAMARAFAEAWDPAWDRAAGGLGRFGLVTLASIVEAEAKIDADRPLIAAVYRNRLRLGMPLQADPTVQYAILLATGRRKTRLYEKDYLIQSPYNTYLRAGLPPGPIGAPGRKSLEAVAAPADVPYLYFVAGPDGSHHFSRTYSEHLRMIRRLRG